MRSVFFATALAATTIVSTFAQKTPIPESPAIEGTKTNVPIVSLETSLGTIIFELDKTKAPKTVKNFLHYVETGFYEGTVFHRVISDFMIQGGGYGQEPENTLVEKATRPPVSSEAKNGLSNLKGTIAMARKEDSANSATSQFFINTVDNTRLDPPSIDGVGYTVFGQVTKGMDIVEKIAGTPTTIRKVQARLGNGSVFTIDLPNVPVTDVVIKKAVYVNDPTPPAPEQAPDPESASAPAAPETATPEKEAPAEPQPAKVAQ